MSAGWLLIEGDVTAQQIRDWCALNAGSPVPRSDARVRRLVDGEVRVVDSARSGERSWTILRVAHGEDWRDDIEGMVCEALRDLRRPIIDDCWPPTLKRCRAYMDDLCRSEGQ